MAACEAPRWVPTRTTSSDCGRPATLAVRRGATGTHLGVCEACAHLFAHPVPLTEIEAR